MATNKQSTLVRILIILAIYLAIRYLGGSIGRTILYPINLFVTFLHEFGHGLGAILTNGSVENLQINEDGSGFAVTRGGNRAIILMGGYLGSAILGNLLFFIGVRMRKFSRWTLLILAALMLFAGIKWFNSLFTTGLLIAFAIVLVWIANKTRFHDEVLMFLGLASILYIIEDFNVGPSSDLAAYAETMVILPASAWMYIWLAIALLLTGFNLWLIFKRDRA